MDTCKCTSPGGDNYGFTYDPTTGLWLHAACRRPTALFLAAMREDHTND